MWYYANVKLWMYPTICLQAILGSGHYPHQVLQMLLILLSHKSLQLLHTLPITPAQFCVSQLLTPPSTFVPRNRNNFLLQHQRPGGCTCSAPTTAKFPCANAHDDLARPCHRPRHSGQMSSPAFRCYLTENHMMSKGLTRPPTL